MDGNNIAQVFHTNVFHLDGLALGGTKLLLAEATLQVRQFAIEIQDHQMVSHSVLCRNIVIKTFIDVLFRVLLLQFKQLIVCLL